MQENNEISLERKKLNEVFDARSRKEGIKLSEPQFDNEVLDKINRLYFIGFPDWEFAIDLDERLSSIRHEILVSKTGMYKEIDLLTLFVPTGTDKYEEIWDIYKSWKLIMDAKAAWAGER